MTIKEFARFVSENYNVPVEWAEEWFKAFCDSIFDALSREDVDSIPLPYVGTIKKDYIFPRSRWDMNKREFVDTPGRMTLKYKPSSKLDAKIRQMEPRPEMADAAKKKRRARAMPEKRQPSAEPPEEKTD